MDEGGIGASTGIVQQLVSEAGAISALEQLSQLPGLPLDMMDDMQRIISSTKKKSTTERQTEQIIDDLKSAFDFCRVMSLQYSEPLSIWFKKKGTPQPFKPFSENPARILISAMIQKRGFGISSKKAKNVYDTLKDTITDGVDVVPNDIIRVSNNLYWDTKEGELLSDNDTTYDMPTPSSRCFRELFDSSGQSDVQVDIEKVRVERYQVNIIRRFLEENEGVIPDPTTITPEDLAPREEDFKDEEEFLALRDYASATMAQDTISALTPFWTWANHNVDTMNDILKVFSVPFMRVPPKWFVYYIGDTRNGKSSCIKCQRIMLGLNNTSGFAMPALFDPHNTFHVLTTMLNAADEDYDFPPSELQQGLANFKKAATHDELDLPNYYSQMSTTLTPKFLSIFSRNSLPNFGDGDGAQAVNKRMRAIFFRNDLSQRDNNGHDFEKETYTAKYYSKLLPVVMAMAQHFNNRVMDMSITCRNNSGAVESVTDPAGYFFNELCYWFDYAGKTDFIIDQAKLFFKENGVKYTGDTLTAINRKLAQCEKGRLRPYEGSQSKRPLCKVLPNKLNRKRIKILAQDAVLSAWDERDFDSWRRAKNEALSKLQGQEAFDYEVPSVFYILRELESDMLDPVVMQEAMLEKFTKDPEEWI